MTQAEVQIRKAVFAQLNSDERFQLALDILKDQPKFWETDEFTEGLEAYTNKRRQVGDLQSELEIGLKQLEEGKVSKRSIPEIAKDVLKRFDSKKAQ